MAVSSKSNNNILFLEAVQNFGGARISTLELAKRLNGEYPVSIVDFYGSCFPFVRAASESGIKLEILDQRNDPYIINRSKSRIKNFFNKIQFIPHWFSLRNKLLRIISLNNPSYIVVNNYKTLLILSFFINKKFKVLFFARGWFVPHKINILKRYLLKINVDKFICVSESTRQALYCGKIADLKDMLVVHNAIDEEKLDKGVADLKCDKDEFVIFHSGGFLPEKGQLTSLEVAKLLKTNGIKFKLIIAGLIYKGYKSQNFHQIVLKKIEEYQLQDFVQLVTDKTNVIPYFRACDVLIHPSATEGLPRVLMEAMVLKKPVIANAVGGVTDYILSGYTGYISNYNDAEDYYRYILKLLEDKEEYNFIANNAYLLIKRCFTEFDQIESFKKVFEL